MAQITLAELEARGLALGIVKSSLTPTIRVALYAAMIAERELEGSIVFSTRQEAREDALMALRGREALAAEAFNAEAHRIADVAVKT